MKDLPKHVLLTPGSFLQFSCPHVNLPCCFNIVLATPCNSFKDEIEQLTMSTHTLSPPRLSPLLARHTTRNLVMIVMFIMDIKEDSQSHARLLFVCRQFYCETFDLSLSLSTFRFGSLLMSAESIPVRVVPRIRQGGMRAYVV